jgi:hypothetical protein
MHYQNSANSSYSGPRDSGTDFKNGTKLTRYFEDHGSQFDYTNEHQYSKGTSDFLNLAFILNAMKIKKLFYR